MAQKYHPDKNPEGRVRLKFCMLCGTLQYFGVSLTVINIALILPLGIFFSLDLDVVLSDC